ncbi:hypothetical protein DPEC_G00159500 [Dallia pectoralis]|uniref:Uncharacterized protein n=1 Tax=Dallia pectoralis TaxID=75939 RepID=A0ACC2GG58_DALPE|nr:hypothetical protein DPEC_G00159500 [Dallia pectoralis]
MEVLQPPYHRLFHCLHCVLPNSVEVLQRGFIKIRGLSWVFFKGRSEYGGFSITLRPLKLIFLLTGLLFLLFHLCGLGVLMTQTGAPVLLTLLLFRGKLISRERNLGFRQSELLEIWRKGQKTVNVDMYNA